LADGCGALIISTFIGGHRQGCSQGTGNGNLLQLLLVAAGCNFNATVAVQLRAFDRVN